MKQETRNLAYLLLTMMAVCFVAICIVMAFAIHAEAQATAPVTLVFLNECSDIDPVNPDWTCLNRTQAAQKKEIFEQVWAASYNTKTSKPVTIYSIDPIIDSRGGYNFGAWKINGKILYAAMPGCANARKKLERLLRQERARLRK